MTVVKVVNLELAVVFRQKSASFTGVFQVAAILTIRAMSPYPFLFENGLKSKTLILFIPRR